MEQAKSEDRLSSVITQLHTESALFVKSRESTNTPDDLPLKSVLDTKGSSRTSSHPNARVPTLIQWRTNFDFCALPPQRLPVVPAVSQESVVVSDLLLCLTGISGVYIQPKPLIDNRREFTIHPDIESCIASIAESILPLASNYSTLVRFVNDQKAFTAGRVNQALAEALQNLLRDYLGVITALHREHKTVGLHLQVLYSKVQPYVYTFQIFGDICSKVTRETKGGRTLSLLLDFARNCSGKTELLLQHLLESAAVPYMQQLHTWLTRGVVNDPYNEFLIENNQVIKERDILPDEYCEDYWSKCYTICRERVPDFLNPYTEIILRTGKYLNVLRQCGVKRPEPSIKELQYSCTENLYAEGIRLAHEKASAGLLHHLMVDMDLPGHLKSVRNYLLLAQGDLITMFMDMATLELNKRADDVVPGRLQSLLELALRTSSARSDPYKDLLRADMRHESVLSLLMRISNKREIVTTDATGWEAATLTYAPPWPVSLVLSPSTLTLYQLMFRHLFFCRHVEILLCRVWLDHKRSDLWAAWALRQRMLLYVHNLEYYMLIEVIEPQWNDLMAKLPQLKNLDEVLEYHSSFLSECLVKCMLNTPKHFKALNNFLKKCVEFCKFMDTCALVEASPQHAAKVLPATAEEIEFQPSESFDAKIAEFNRVFTQHVHYLFNTLGDMSASRRKDQLNDMLYRLDFNSYYQIKVGGGGPLGRISSSSTSLSSRKTGNGGTQEESEQDSQLSSN